MRIAVYLSLVTVLLVAAGCGGGGGPDADEGKSEDQIREQAAKMDKATLKNTIDAYNAKLEELTDSAKGDITKMADGLGAKIEKLNANLKIYLQELAKK